MQNIRQQIDKIDNEILDLFTKRFLLVKEIGTIKKQNNIPIQDKKREAEEKALLVEKGQEKGIEKDFITKIWDIIFSESYLLEHKI